ncbi:MAG: CBS domain-containing protein [Pseudomonadota bacterium]
MWIERYITRRVITIGPGESIVAARELMTTHHIRHLPVVDRENRLMGIISDRDIRSALSFQGGDARLEPGAAPMVGEIMTTTPLTISPGFTLQDVLLQFYSKKVGAFPVTDEEGRVTGILSDRDLLNCFIQVLGLGTPGCFIGLDIDPDEGKIKTVVDVLAAGGYPVASMLVVRDWRPERWAMFLYVLSQNRVEIRHRLADAGFSTIEPLDWMLTPFERRAA